MTAETVTLRAVARVALVGGTALADDDDPWDMKGKDVAEVLHCDESQVYRYARAGKLPHRLTVGGQRRYRRSDVNRLLAGGDDSGSESSPAPAPSLADRVAALEARVERLEHGGDLLE